MYDRGIDFRLGSNTDRRPSPAIWDRCPFEKIQSGDVDGIAIFDDFSRLPLQPTLTTQIGFGDYKAFGDTGNTITRVVSINSALVAGGALQMAIDTDNDEVALAHAYPSFLTSGLTTNSGKLWFEVCYAQSSILTNMAAGFVGLANVAGITLSTTVPFNDGDPIDATMYGVGFRIAEDGLGVIDTVVTDGATSFTNIGATEGGTLAAFTFRKLGMMYDPTNVTNCITFYADNVPLATTISRSTLTGYTNLDVNGLGFLIAHSADSAGTTFKSFLEWIKICQIAPGVAV